MTYYELSQRHQKEVDEFPLFFAFSNKQFYEGMKRLELGPEDTDKIYRLGDTGGYYRKSDSDSLHEMFARHQQEMETAIAEDPTGDGFIYDMFKYELNNHEFGYTRDTGSTLDALGLDFDDVNADPRLKHGLEKACKEIIQWNDRIKQQGGEQTLG